MFLPTLCILVSEIYVVDGKSSKIEFFVNATAHRIHGKVLKVEGEVNYSEEDNTISGYVKVPIKSMKTGNSIRDNAMYKTLKAKKHPYVVFEPKEVNLKEGIVKGNFSLGGITVERTFNLHIERKGDGFEVDGKFPVYLSKHKLKRPKFGFLQVDDRVDVKIHIIFKPKD